MIGITSRSLSLAVFWLGASCPLAASQLSAAKRATAQQFWIPAHLARSGHTARTDQLVRRGARASWFPLVAGSDVSVNVETTLVVDR